MKNALAFNIILRYRDRYEDEHENISLSFYDEYGNGYKFEDKTHHNFVRGNKYHLDIVFSKDDLSAVETSYFATIYGVSEV